MEQLLVCTQQSSTHICLLQEVLAMRMPLKDDAATKEYILNPAYRAQVIASSSVTEANGRSASVVQGCCQRQPCPCPGPGCCQGKDSDQTASTGTSAPQCTRAVAAYGAVWRTIAGADAIQPLLAEPSFVCLHYKLGPGAALQACAPVCGTVSSEQYAR